MMTDGEQDLSEHFLVILGNIVIFVVFLHQGTKVIRVFFLWFGLIVISNGLEQCIQNIPAIGQNIQEVFVPRVTATIHRIGNPSVNSDFRFQIP